MSGPYQGRDLSNCGVGRLRVAINCGVLSVNSYLHHVFERKCTKFCLKHSSYSIRGHIRPSGESLWGKGESLFSPAHPCLTNSRGDSSIQAVINVSSNY